MATLSANASKPPAFLSDHPSDADRIEKIKEVLPEAQNYYKPR
jgi:Zn-dependent protease with chaperone function